MKPLKTAAIVNPRSATGKTGRRWPELASRLPSLDVRFTQAPGHATELTAQCLRDGYHRIVAVGGDGTINEVVNGFLDKAGVPLHRDATLAILPLGTGSDFQKSLGIASIDDAVALLDQEQPSPIDVGRVEYESPSGGRAWRYFANVVSFGMGGEVAARAKNIVSKVSGKGAFLLATGQVFLSYQPKTVTLDVDGQPHGPFTITNIGIGNGRYHGGGMHVCPKALLDDGELEVTVIEALSSYELIRDIKVLYSENLYVHPKTQHLRGRRIVARSQQVVSIEVDGEPLGSLPLELTVIPAAIRVARK